METFERRRVPLKGHLGGWMGPLGCRGHQAQRRRKRRGCEEESWAADRQHECPFIAVCGGEAALGTPTANPFHCSLHDPQGVVL